MLCQAGANGIGAIARLRHKSAAAKIDEIKTRLKQQSDDLVQIADILEKRGAQTVAAMSDQVRDLLARSSDAADRFADLKVSLDDKVRAFDAASKQTGAVSAQLADALHTHKEMLDASVQRMTGYTEEVTAEITRRTTQMDVSADLLKNPPNPKVQHFLTRGEK